MTKLNQITFFLISVLATAAVSPASRADILFLDFDLSYREVAKARAAALAQGEKTDCCARSERRRANKDFEFAGLNRRRPQEGSSSPRCFQL